MKVSSVFCCCLLQTVGKSCFVTLSQSQVNPKTAQLKITWKQEDFSDHLMWKFSSYKIHYMFNSKFLPSQTGRGAESFMRWMLQMSWEEPLKDILKCLLWSSANLTVLLQAAERTFILFMCFPSSWTLGLALSAFTSFHLRLWAPREPRQSLLAFSACPSFLLGYRKTETGRL